MKKFFGANIKWISAEKGGRKNIPKEGTRYCPLIRINSVDSYVEWSIDMICPDFEKSSQIIFSFLVDTAPSEMVKKGDIYELFEGAKKVAQVKIL